LCVNKAYIQNTVYFRLTNLKIVYQRQFQTSLFITSLQNFVSIIAQKFMQPIKSLRKKSDIVHPTNKHKKATTILK